MDDPCGPGSTLPGPLVNASRAVSAGSGESSRRQLFLEVLVVLMCVVTVTGNTLVIATVAATKVFHTLGSALIVNLAVSDLLVGVGVMPWVAASVVNCAWAESTFLCFYVGYTSTVYCTASVLTMAVIALDRYISIVDCLHYSSISTLRRTATAVLWIWVQALVVSFPPLVGWRSLGYVGPRFNCGVSWAWSPAYTGCVAFLGYLLPAAVILFCYMSIVRVARGHVRRIHSLADSVNRLPIGDPSQNQSGRSRHSPSGEVWHVGGQFGGTDSSPPGSPRARSSMATLQIYQQPQNHHCGVLRLFLIIAAFFLCWTPYTVVALVQTTESAVSGQSSLVSPAAATSSYFLVLLSSAINPILYALLCRRFRLALRGLAQRTRARLRGALARTGEEGECRYPRTVASKRPKPPSTSDTDDGKCSSAVFTITDRKSTCREHLGNVYSCEKASRPFSAAGRDGQVDYLYVPPSPQEGSRLPFSALTKAREATFYFGEITVRVEHDVC